jgi:hypothetical protein
VFDGNKAQLFKYTYTQQDAFRKEGILGDHQMIKYLIAAQNKQTTIKVLVFAAANLNPLLILAKCGG